MINHDKFFGSCEGALTTKQLEAMPCLEGEGCEGVDYGIFQKKELSFNPSSLHIFP